MYRYATRGYARNTRSKADYAIRKVNELAPEWKVKYTTISDVVSNAFDAVLLNGLKLGDDVDTREGHEIRMRSLDINLYFDNKVTSPLSTVVRCWLILDTMPDAVGIVSGEFLNNNSAITSHRNLVLRNRFVVFKEWFITLGADGASNQVRWLTKYKKLNHNVTYDDSDTGTISDITYNALYFAHMGVEEVTGSMPEIVASIVLRYTDS